MSREKRLQKIYALFLLGIALFMGGCIPTISVDTTINQDNFGMYKDGFKISDGIVVTWDYDQDKLNGPIAFLGADATLSLASNLKIDSAGMLFDNQGLVPGIVDCNNCFVYQDIDADFLVLHPEFASQGFIVPAATIYNWDAASAVIDGNVDFVAASSQLMLYSDCSCATGDVLPVERRRYVDAQSRQTIWDASSGGMLYCVVNDGNAESYLEGFSVSSQGLYEVPVFYDWKVSATSTIGGGILFPLDDSRLRLHHDLQLERTGWISHIAQVIANGNNIYSSKGNNFVTRITDGNVADYTGINGFNVPANHIYEWAATAPNSETFNWGSAASSDPGYASIVSGPITMDDASASLQLMTDLFVGAPSLEWANDNGSCGSFFTVAGKVPGDGTFIPNGNNLVQWIMPFNQGAYREGFVIPARSRYDWFGFVAVEGPVEFSEHSSLLNLMGNDSDGHVSQGLALTSDGSLFQLDGTIATLEGFDLAAERLILSHELTTGLDFFEEGGGQTYILQDIDDVNVDFYRHGFTIPANSIYNWNSADTIVTGTVIFDTSNALMLSQSLTTSYGGRLVAPVGRIFPTDDQRITVNVGEDSTTYHNGFIIPPYTTFVWNPGAPVVGGSALFSDLSSHLQLNTSLQLNQYGLLFGLDGTVPQDPTNGVIDFNGSIIQQEIDAHNADFYKNGFTIPDQTTYAWVMDTNISGSVIQGNVLFAQDGARLLVNGSLLFDAGYGLADEDCIKQVDVTPTASITSREPGHSYYVSGAAGIDAVVIIDDSNFASLGRNGFTIPAHTIYVWNCSSDKKVNGKIRFNDDSSVLELVQDLYLTAKASLYDQDGNLMNEHNSPSLEGVLVASGHQVIQPVRVGNASGRSHRDMSFVIPADTTLVWEGVDGDERRMFHGSITFVANSSTLKLERDLHLGKASFVIEGDYAQILGEDEKIYLHKDFTLDKPLVVLSELKIVGNGHTLDTANACPAFDIYNQAPLELQNLTMKVLGDTYSAGNSPTGASYASNPFIFWGDTSPVVLDNVVITNGTSPWDSEFSGNRALFCDCDVTAQHNVSVLAYKAFVLWAGASSLIIDDATLALQATHAGSALIDMSLYSYDQAQSTRIPITMSHGATLLLGESGTSCTIYGGFEGFHINDGTVQYAGHLILINADMYSSNNTELKNGIIFDAAVNQIFAPGADLSAQGVVLREINNHNFEQAAERGFEIPSGMTYAWRCSREHKVAGPITIQDTGTLLLYTDLYLTHLGSLAQGVAVINPYGAYQVKRVIDGSCRLDYKDGFTVPDQVTYEWADQDTVVRGDIMVNGTLVLKTDLIVDDASRLDYLNSNVIAGRHNILDEQGSVLLAGINDDNYPIYRYGFTIPDGCAVEWGCSAGNHLEGAIVFSDIYSSLKLATDLFLGAHEQPLMMTQYTGRVYGNSKRIILGADCAITSPLQVFSQLEIIGNGKQLYASCCPLLSIYTDGLVALRDMSLMILGDTQSPGFQEGEVDFAGNPNHGPYVCWGGYGQLELDRLTVTALSPCLSNYLYGYFSGVYLSNVTIDSPRSAVKLGGDDAATMLAYAYDSLAVIAANTQLHVTPRTPVQIGLIENALLFEDPSAALYLDGCDFYTGPAGLMLTHGNLVFDHGVYLRSRGLDTVEHAIFQCGDGSSPVTIDYLQGSVVRVEGNFCVDPRRN